MRKVLSATFVSCVLLFLPLNVSAEKMVFGMVDDFPPYQYTEAEKPCGADADIVSEVCIRLGIEPEFQVMPWKRVLKNAEDGDISAVLALLFKEERTKVLYYTKEPIHINRDSVIALKGSGMKISGLDDLKGKKVGVMSGYSYGPDFDNYKELNKILCDDHKSLIRILDAGRIDAAVAAETPFMFNSKKMGFKDRFETVYVISENPAYTGFSQKSCGENGKIMAEKFSEVLRQLKAEGMIEKIMEKYR